MVNTTRYIDYFDIIYDVREAIFCFLHKYCNMPWKNFTIKRQFIGRNKVLSVRIVPQLSVLRPTKRVQQVTFVNKHAELGTARCFDDLLVSRMNNLNAEEKKR